MNLSFWHENCQGILTAIVTGTTMLALLLRRPAPDTDRLAPVHKIQILIRETLEECLRNFFGEEIGGVRGTQTP